MFTTRTKAAELDTSGLAAITARARQAGSPAVATAQNLARNAADVAQNAAQNAAEAAQHATQNAGIAAQHAAQNASVAAQHAAQTASVAAQHARQVAAENARQGAASAAQTTTTVVKRGVSDLRTWAAPRLEDAADYTTATAAPAVSSALRATARKVSPGEATARGRARSALTWSLLAAAALAAGGAVAAFVRYRNRAATAADNEATDGEATDNEAASSEATDIDADSTGRPAPKTAPKSTPASGEPIDKATTDVEASVNGRAPRDGW